MKVLLVALGVCLVSVAARAETVTDMPVRQIMPCQEVLDSSQTQYQSANSNLDFVPVWRFAAASGCESFDPGRLFPTTDALKTFLDGLAPNAWVFDYHLTLTNDSPAPVVFAFADPALAFTPYGHLARGPQYEIPACSRVLFWFLSPEPPSWVTVAAPMYVLGNDGSWVPLGGEVPMWLPKRASLAPYHPTGVFVSSIPHEESVTLECRSAS